jgi:hypothetical protein
MPMLPNLKQLCMNSRDLNRLDAMTLTIWFLLAPNVEELDLELLRYDAQMELAEQLNKLGETDERVRTILDRIHKVNLLSVWNVHNTPKEEQLFRTFGKSFPKAVVFPSLFSVKFIQKANENPYVSLRR